jgi:hypothetical protein
MRITASQQAALDAHLIATSFQNTRYRAPRAVYTAIAALVDPAEIRGSHGEFLRLKPTTWRIWVMTSTHLAYVEIKFENEDEYDADEEAKRIDPPEGPGFRRDPARGQLVSAWVRPLVRAERLTLDSIDRDYAGSGFEADFRLHGVAIEFADGLRTPGEGFLRCRTRTQRAEGDSERWDEFIAGIRRGSPLLTLELGSLSEPRRRTKITPGL